jgi:hypothetical protein
MVLVGETADASVVIELIRTASGWTGVVTSPRSGQQSLVVRWSGGRHTEHAFEAPAGRSTAFPVVPMGGPERPVEAALAVAPAGEHHRPPDAGVDDWDLSLFLLLAADPASSRRSVDVGPGRPGGYVEHLETGTFLRAVAGTGPAPDAGVAGWAVELIPGALTGRWTLGVLWSDSVVTRHAVDVHVDSRPLVIDIGSRGASVAPTSVQLREDRP